MRPYGRRFRCLFALAVPLIGALALVVLTSGSPRAEQPRVRWNLSSAYPSTLPQLGTLGKRVTERLEEISDGRIRLRFREPGALVPALEVFDAVSSGAIEAAWSTPGYWAGKVPALQLFGAVPFGPEPAEYLAWYHFGGGRPLFEEIYRSHGIHGVLCGVLPPEASGWFRSEVRSISDLEGLKMRFFGLGAKVMEKLGVSTQLLAPGDIFPALELGSIDATEFSMPAIDTALGFAQVAKHYYFPGWHQQATFFELIVNIDRWESLTPVQKTQIEAVCGDSVSYALAEGEAIQFDALSKLEADGVQIHRWPPEILDALEKAWAEVVEEESAKDEDFARVWASLASFRKKYAVWRALGYLH